MNDDQLRLAYARQLAQARRASSVCPSPETLLALAEQRGTEEERLATLDHVMACAACRRDLDLLRAVTVVGDQMTRGPASWVSRPFAAAAVLVLLVGAGVWLTQRTDTDQAVWRGAIDGALVSPSGTVPQSEGGRFVWRTAPGAVRYEVELLTAAGDSVFASITTDTVQLLPPGVTLLAGGDYVWSVRAVLGDGTRTPSAPLRFRIQ